ncbi:YgjP-like metallopeptidase domain-containing protein [Paenibacillus chitinolyticus]|uniref:YgjP-like metallopeptidase domain-containing protein n=1 Tax=Paenibacillus chitinolyticus TaxID=79263 RepID=UPI003522EF85
MQCLYVRPPNGNVTVSAPLSMSDEAIERFVRTKVSWIRKQISKFDNLAGTHSGETLYAWGKQYSRFANYTDLQTCLTTNVLCALNAALVRGVTVAGKRFKLEKLK